MKFSFLLIRIISTEKTLQALTNANDYKLLCGMVDRRKAFGYIFSPDRCQRFSPSRISDTPQAEFETVQSLISGFVE